MSRIRTIKPSFFTSDDICALSPFARLFYIGIWGEADREGRLKWKPRELKRKILPEDSCDPEEVALELVKQGLVILYGDGLAVIPTFLRHQVINAHEAASRLPPPAEGEVPGMHMHAGALPVVQSRKGKESKGKERKEEEHSQSNNVQLKKLVRPLPEDWQPSVDDMTWATDIRTDLDADDIERETASFRAHAMDTGRKTSDWNASWRRWIKNTHASSSRVARHLPTHLHHKFVLPGPDGQWRFWIANYKPGDEWDEAVRGPRPEGLEETPNIPDVARREWRKINGYPPEWRRTSF